MKGSIAALSTPFMGDDLDMRAFRDLVTWQILEGSAGLAVGGATGEGPTLSEAEFLDLVGTCVEVSAGRVPVLAGICCSGTARAVEAAREAASAGADGILVSTPAYNKPLQEGLFRHFETIARAARRPLIILNDPGRTRVDLDFETVRRLSEIDTIVGIVDRSGDPERPHVTALVSGGRLRQWAGDDAAAVMVNMAGGQGCLSIAAAVAPRLCSAIEIACRSGDWTAAHRLQQMLRPLTKALRLEPDPAPVKFALSQMFPGFSPSLRLPLVQVSPATAEAISAALEACDECRTTIDGSRSATDRAHRAVAS